jgi:hypothetical protein
MKLFEKLLLYAVMQLFVICGAHAYDLEEGTGIVCDQKDQLVRYFTLINEGKHALQIVDTEAKANVCVIATVAYIRGASAARIEATQRPPQNRGDSRQRILPRGRLVRAEAGDPVHRLLRRRGARMTDRCEKCGKPHKHHCFEKIGRVIYWFCGFSGDSNGRPHSIRNRNVSSWKQGDSSE